MHFFKFQFLGWWVSLSIGRFLRVFFGGGGETKVFPKLNFVFVESALAPSGGAEWCFEISILSFLNFFYN